MNFEIAPSAGDALERLSRWASIDESERRRRATEACRDRNIDELWSLTEARLTLFGRAGARTSRHTTEAYKTGVRRLVKSWSGVQLLRATPNDGALYVRQMESAGLSPSTVSVRLAGARALYAALRWACTTTEHACNVDPFRDVHPAPDKTPAHAKRSPYPDADIDRLVAVATGEDLALLYLGAHTGLRNFEILALRWQDIDLPGRRLIVESGKGRKRRMCPLSRSLAAALAALPHAGEYVIASYRTTEQARRHMRDLCDRAGIQRRGVHALRHTAGTRLYRQTGKLEDAQNLLGHSDISTTQVYAVWSDQTTKNALADW